MHLDHFDSLHHGEDARAHHGEGRRGVFSATTSPITTNPILARIYSPMRTRLSKNIFADSQQVASIHMVKVTILLVNQKRLTRVAARQSNPSSKFIKKGLGGWEDRKYSIRRSETVILSRIICRNLVTIRHPSQFKMQSYTSTSVLLSKYNSSKCVSPDTSSGPGLPMTGPPAGRAVVQSKSFPQISPNYAGQSNLFRWQTFLPCRPAQPHRGARHWNARGRTATTPAPRGHLPTRHLRVLSSSSFQFSKFSILKVDL